MKYYSTIIFDFDGTIANSFIATYKAYNSLAEKYNLRPIPEEDISIVRTMKPFELLSYCKIPFYLVPILLIEGRQLIKASMKDIQPIEGIKEIIDVLSKKYTLGILTSNSEENVQNFLKEQKMEVFSFIHSEKNVFGKDKALIKLLNEHTLEKDKTIYIGDEVRDIDSCQKINLSIISVTWGFNESGILGKHNPTYKVDYPNELLTLL